MPDRDDMLIMDPAPFARHRLDCVTATQKTAIKIDRMDAVPFFEAGMFGVMRTGAVFEAGDARVIDDDVYRGIRAFKCRPVFLGCDIKLEKAAADRVGDALTRFAVEVADYDRCTFAGKAAGDCLTDTSRAAGD